MSRLDSFIRRMQAQRDCLNNAAGMIADVPGAVFDLGLGNGRTFDHLRETLPDREVFVFDRVVNANPKSTPDADHLFLGEVVDQLALQQSRFANAVALVHSDLGTGTAEDAPLTAALIPLLRPVLASGAVLVANNPFPDAGWEALPLPDGVPAERYFMYRVGA
ncbi:MAG: class I SAM-dependent methyltransferase [Alphaproteobacteria bacterium]